MEELIDVLDENGNKTGEILTREQIDLTDIKMQESEVQQVKLCNLKEFSEIIKNGNIMERDEFYKKIIKYLK